MGTQAAVPDPPVDPDRTATNVGSLYGMTIPTQSAPPMKKSPNLQYIVLNAAFK